MADRYTAHLQEGDLILFGTDGGGHHIYIYIYEGRVIQFV
jgi:cell wall-associated NlpC family hydrolase